GQAPGEDRDEDDVVDAQDQFQRGQGGQRDPDLGVVEGFHRGLVEGRARSGMLPPPGAREGARPRGREGGGNHGNAASGDAPSPWDGEGLVHGPVAGPLLHRGRKARHDGDSTEDYSPSSGHPSTGTGEARMENGPAPRRAQARPASTCSSIRSSYLS